MPTLDQPIAAACPPCPPCETLPAHDYRVQEAYEELIRRTPTVQGAETVLDQIETTSDRQTPKARSRLQQLKAEFVQRLRSQVPPGTDLRNLQELEQCGTQWAIYWEDGELHARSWKCHRRECPVCASIRRHQWYERGKRAISIWTAPKHIALTISSRPEPLPQQIDRLLDAFRQLRERRIWTDRSPWGIWTLEITYNANTGLYHPHVHIICNMRYLHFSELSAEWYDITGDSFITHINAVDADIAKYIAKYVSKASNVFWQTPDLPGILADLKGRRMVNKFGSWPVKVSLPKPWRIFQGTIPALIAKARRGDDAAKGLLVWCLRNAYAALAESLVQYAARESQAVSDLIRWEYEPPPRRLSQQRIDQLRAT